ncbi:hypothetical protein V8C42DRAFT_339883 [Trichoderma barbatum]
MQFKSIALLTIALSVNQAHATLTAKDVVNGIHNITELSTDTLDAVKDLNPENVAAKGLKAVQDFRQIATDAANENAAIASASDSLAFAEVDQQDICETFSGFVKAQEDLLQGLISQKSFLSSIPLSMPLGAVLRFLNVGIGKLSVSIIGLVPSCAEESKKEFKALNETLKETLKAYPVKLHLPGVVGTPLGLGLGQ